jgi:hypothetical protein
MPAGGESALPDGPYNLGVAFAETRSFGPLVIARDSALTTSFWVGAASPASCHDVPDGLHCGHHGVNADPATLYFCSGGIISVVTSCSTGCATHGTSDRCN